MVTMHVVHVLLVGVIVLTSQFSINNLDLFAFMIRMLMTKIVLLICIIIHRHIWMAFSSFLFPTFGGSVLTDGRWMFETTYSK
mmetsp:Transcript_30092/g.34130  ORF Transcript_30092/g.34130 Transcript_30092/m.34130 type:complete len:83 (+) Transcript_30092:35-283(+)